VCSSDLAQSESNAEETSVQHYWTLRAPSEDKTGGLEWKLTEPATGTPSLLDAMINYVIEGHASDNHNQKIPYDQIKNLLRLVKENDAARRIQNDHIAYHDKDLRQKLEDFLPPLLDNGEEDLSHWMDENDEQYLQIATMLSHHDTLYDLYNSISESLDKLKQELDDPESTNNNTGSDLLHQRELYDLFSVSIIALQDEISTIRDMIDRYHAQHFRSSQ
jgi:hypothetical protein